MKNLIMGGVVIIAILLILGGIFYFSEKSALQRIETFKDCLEGGYPVMESFPRQCRTPDGRSFTEEIPAPAPTGREDLIVVISPTTGAIAESPLEIRGKARGFWFFEASFPVSLRGENGEILANGIATAQSDWMTEDFVPFKATLIFNPGQAERGVLILEKDNPSGLPENDDSLEVPVEFEPKILGACIVTGCSGEICANKETATTCEFRAEYACYKETLCERQENEECGWTETESYRTCMANI